MAWDRYPDGYGTPAVSDVLEGADVYSPLLYGSMPRFQIIKELQLWTSNAKRQYVETYKCKLGGPTTSFVTYDGDDADIVKNALMILMISDENTNPPQVAYYSRVHFYDA
jgi:hypothetical protein